MTDHLAALQFIGAWVSWFLRDVRGKGTDKWAAGLPLLYKRALDRLDASHHKTRAGQTGPLVRRLQGFGKLEGLVVGPWGEGSKDIHSLLKVLAETKLAAKARALWRPMSDKELGGHCQPG